MTRFNYDGFVHLRTRSTFSLAEGSIPVAALARSAAEAGMPAVAITDNNNLFGALQFSEDTKAKGVQPIIGAIVSIRIAGESSLPPMTDELVLLCQSAKGYQSLCRIVTKSHLENSNNANPEIKLSEALADNEGLICLWGGENSSLVKLLLSNPNATHVDELAARYKVAFGDRLYIELQRCGEPWERQTEARILELADRHNLPLVATNDVYFESQRQHQAHDVLLCIKGARYEVEEDRRRITKEHFFKSSDAMKRLFHDVSEAITNTVEIAQRCAFAVPKRAPLLPVFPLPENQSPDDVLDYEAHCGFEERFKTVIGRLGEAAAESVRPKYLERLNFELSVIKGMDFSGYFLIVSDFMKHAKREGIPVGVRGSGATSIVAWCMYITNLDPIRFDLVFERFLNPERVSLPDFDIDFCQERRGEVIDYVRTKYGSEYVAQIITFGTLQAKAAVRDVGRVIGVPFPLVDRLCKLIGNSPTLEDAISSEKAIGDIMQQDVLAQRCIAIAKDLQGLYRHASTHAAGVIISDRPLVELLPLYKDPNSDMPVTQFHFKDAEKAGLVKFDFLGLRTLTIVSKAVQMVRQTRGIEVDFDDLDFDDSSVYEMLRSGDVSGVFQLESAGMRNLLKRLQPERIEQLIALISLYRPGPMDSIPTYIARAQLLEPVSYDHPILEKVLAETYGVITYQEDVMQIARVMGGYSMGEADLLRRAMGKKIKAEMDVHRAQFCGGAAKQGVPAAVADAIFEQCAKFAGYGFNKGHAAAYAQVSYQTAFLKYHYELEFYASCMTIDREQIDRLATYARELRERGSAVLPPDINTSRSDFVIEETKDGRRIRYGLAALKGVGAGITSSIVAERDNSGPFKDLEDFFERCAPIGLSRSVVEQLVKSGAFDRLERNRALVLDNIGDFIRGGEVAWSERTSEQGGLFGKELKAAVRVERNEVPRSKLDDLRDEVASIGYFVSGHPLDEIFEALAAKGVITISEAVSGIKQAKISVARIAGVIHSVQTRRSQTGNKYGFVNLSDPSGDLDAMVFSELLATQGDLLKSGEQVIATIAGRIEDDSARLSIVRLQPISAGLGSIKSVRIEMDGSTPQFISQLDQLKGELVRRQQGKAEVQFALSLPDGRNVTIVAPGTYHIDANFVQVSPARWGRCSVLDA